MTSRIYAIALVLLSGLVGLYAPAVAIAQSQNLPIQVSDSTISQDAISRKAKADRLKLFGNQQFDKGRYREALLSYQAALDIYQAIKDRKGEGISLYNMGLSYHFLEQYAKAIIFHKQSLEIFREINERSLERNTTGLMGIAYYFLGQYEKAISYSQQYLEISHKTNDRAGEERAINSLGAIYTRLGQYEKAISFHYQQLKIAYEIKDRGGEGAALVNIGDAYQSLGQYEKAITFFQQYLAISREIKNRAGETLALNSLGIAYNNLGHYSNAIELHQQSLEIAREINVLEHEGNAINGLGNVYQNLGQYEKAIDFHRQYLTISRKTKNRDEEAESLKNLGLDLAKLKQSELAIVFYKLSINIRESIRKDIHDLDKELQKSYLSTVEKTYRNLADLLLKQDRLLEALQILDLLKIQELEDYLKNIKGNDRTSQGIQLLEPEKAISSELSSLKFDKISELNNKLKNQIQQLPKSEINKVPEYLQKLPQGQVLIYPLILDDRLEIIIFSPNTTPVNRTVTIKKPELEEIILTLRVELRDFGSLDFKTTSKKLYDILIKPIETELKQATANTIIYAPDGILRYIPLAALYDGKQYLIEKYAITNPIAYILTDFAPKAKNQPNILAGAFGGKQGEKRFGLDGLPATIVEVSAISKLIQNSTAIAENEFSRKAIETQLDKYNILHLATHAAFNTGTPDNSFIIFGNGDTIRLSEIPELKLANIDLIVLSACQTAVGKLGSGVEILGFGYQVQKAGARSAIASLWTVSDEGTQVLMKSFYENVKRNDLAKSAALRQAQIDLIRSKNFSHPYYWSPFILIGNGL